MNRKRDRGVNATSKRRLGPRGLEATRVRPPLGVPVAQPCCFSPHSGASSGPGPGQLHTQKKQKYNFFFFPPPFGAIYFYIRTHRKLTPSQGRAPYLLPPEAIPRSSKYLWNGHECRLKPHLADLPFAPLRYNSTYLQGACRCGSRCVPVQRKAGAR